MAVPIRTALRRTGIALVACSLLVAAVAVASCVLLVSRGGARSITEITGGGAHITWNPRRTDGSWPWQGWRPVRARSWTSDRLWGLPRRGRGAIGGWPFVTVPLGPPAMALGAAGGVCLLAAVRRPGSGRCPECGYNLAGLAAGSVCPECGTA
jgi:hypothetical protein